MERNERGVGLAEMSSEARTSATEPVTGHVPVNGLQMYYEIHGSGGTPLLLLHGGLFNIDLQFAAVLPGLVRGRSMSPV